MMKIRGNRLTKMAIVWGFVLLLIGPSRATATGPEFDKIVDDYVASRFAYRPSEGTAAGLHEYDNQLEDLSRERAIRRIDELRQFQQRFSALKRQSVSGQSKLSADDTIDLTVLEGQIEAELIDLEVIREWEHNPMGYVMLPGNAVDLLIKRDFAPASDRLRSVIAREKAIPAVFEAAKRNLKEPPKEFTDLAIRMAKGSGGFFEGSVATWARQAAGQDKELLAAFEVANAQVVTAVRQFLNWLEVHLTPRSTGWYAIGKQLFLAKLKAGELVEISLADLLARGEANLDKDYR